MNDDSSGIDGTGSESSERMRSASDSADLTRLLAQGFEPVTPLPDTWDRIDDQLWSTNNARRERSRFGFVAAAAAIVLLIGTVGTLGAIASRTASANQPASVAQAAVIRDLSDPVSGNVELTIHTEPDGSSIAVATHSLPVLDNSSTYQLWSVVGDEVVSVGVFGRSIDSAALRLEGNPAVLALTVESTGGVAVSSAEPVAVWTSTG